MSLSFVTSGDYKNTFGFLESVKEKFKMGSLDKYGRMGVEALRQATPVDSGETRELWDYKITRGSNHVTVEWTNDHINDGVPIAIILQYGHATKNGGWVEGRDYINPAIQPIFDKMVNDAWEEVVQ